MKFTLKSLKLICERSEEYIPFGRKISFFHGEMSTGKSTIVELIKFCFGGRLVRTPAITSELHSVQLIVSTSRNEFIIERYVSHESTVYIYLYEDEEFSHLVLPIKAGEAPIYEDVYNLSDFLLTQLGIPPIKVRKRKTDPDSDLHRLSFRDFYRFCYLDQPDLDSSFFKLESPIQAEKSKDVLKYILGFQSETLLSLQQDLAQARQDQKALLEAAKQIHEFLVSYGYSSESEISSQIKQTQVQIADLEQRKLDQVDNRTEVVFASDMDVARSEQLKIAYHEKLEAIHDIEARIQEQEALAAELTSLKFKAARSSSATDILSRAKFLSCPQCGTEVQEPKHKDQCGLCKSNISHSTINPLRHVPAIEQDLNDRIHELKFSINRLTKSFSAQQKELERIVEERKNVQWRIDSTLSKVESEYMQLARQIESSLGRLYERQKQLVKLKEMPAEIERRNNEADRLGSTIQKILRRISEEEKRFHQGRENVERLEINFLKILQSIHFPEITDADKISINTRTFIPYVYPDGNADRAWSFRDAGSGGKMVLFKTCFTLALHKTAAELDLFIPRLFIVDSTMKNIAPDINHEVFDHFYQELYRLLKDELIGWQTIIVDQTFHPFLPDSVGVYERLLTKDDPIHPPLISYYHGH